jgi:hypothetical protein
MGTETVKRNSIATPFADPRTGQLYFRRAIPQPLWPAFGGKRERKITLGTKDPVAAKELFARLNAEFERDLAEARRKLAEGTLLPTPGMTVRRWIEGLAFQWLGRRRTFRLDHWCRRQVPRSDPEAC